jgi:hypothetical protein
MRLNLYEARLIEAWGKSLIESMMILIESNPSPEDDSLQSVLRNPYIQYLHNNNISEKIANE